MGVAAVCLLALTGWLRAEVPADVRLEAAVKAAGELPRLRSLLVNYRGDLVVERYFNGARASRQANVKSVAKSIISALVGIAIDRGLIQSVDTPISEFFPSLRAEDADPKKRKITVENLLTMQSGLQSTSGRNYGVWVQSRNWVQHVLTRRMVVPPGTEMEYSTGNTHLLSAILTKVTGTSTWQFAQKALAEPLGFNLSQWDRDPQGIYFGGNNMAMTPRQMVAFGELYRDLGRAGGRQVVSAEWVEKSFVPRGRSHWSEELYGYGWWIGELAGLRTYYAWGFGGQFIFIVPEAQLVIVTTSSESRGTGRRGHRDGVYELVERLVVEPMAN